jgi:sporulation protein YlmC with PRC-barrel domain
MRLSELLGQRVVSASGADIGQVADVRLVQDGPLLTSMQAALRVDGLIVVEGRTIRLFGYERHVGPAALRWLFHRRLGVVRYLPWRDVADVTEGVVRTRAGRDRLVPLESRARS